MAVACKCQQCGKVFTTRPSQIKNGRGKYCSRDCHGLSNRNQVACTCEQCGESFTVYPSAIKRGYGKYCSRDCRDLSRGGQVTCTCQQCGEAFIADSSAIKNGNGKYCSRDCRDLSYRNQVSCACEQCGKVFTATPSAIKRGGGKYCGRDCFGQSRRGEKHPFWRGGYKNYRGENWKRQRKLAYQRDQGICKHCGKKPKKGQQQFEVHHIKRFADFNGDYVAANQLTNLITLCRQCHVPAELGKIAVQPYLL